MRRKLLSIFLLILFLIPANTQAIGGSVDGSSTTSQTVANILSQPGPSKIPGIASGDKKKHDEFVEQMKKDISAAYARVRELQTENAKLKDDYIIVKADCDRLEIENEELERQLYGSCSNSIIPCGKCCTCMERCAKKTGTWLGGFLFGIVVTVVATVIIGGIVFYILKVRNPSHSSGILLND